MRWSVNFCDSAAPPTSIGVVTPADVRSCAVVTICWALFDEQAREADEIRPVLADASTSFSGGTLMPRLTTS